ncbi:exosortase H-associated membrane protein [Marinicella sp. W31]|uniref:exosortase H-associated membrane protein n=1 Tax=Marinicella sp. W31 TaxID=3023713 RepID=UPI0037575A91
MRSPIRHLFVSAVLFLPLCFFIWFLLSSVLVLPVHGLSEWILTTWQPDLFKGIVQNQYVLNIETLVFIEQNYTGQEHQLAVLQVTVNPMIYGYGLAVFAGLTLSVPNLNWQKRVIHIGIAYLVVVFIQSFGVFWETLKQLLFSSGPEAQQAVLELGINANIIAGLYQITYLILPAVVPVALWVGLNKEFLNTLIGLNNSGQKL